MSTATTSQTALNMERPSDDLTLSSLLISGSLNMSEPAMIA